VLVPGRLRWIGRRVSCDVLSTTVLRDGERWIFRRLPTIYSTLVCCHLACCLNDTACGSARARTHTPPHTNTTHRARASHTPALHYTRTRTLLHTTAAARTLRHAAPSPLPLLHYHMFAALRTAPGWQTTALSLPVNLPVCWRFVCLRLLTRHTSGRRWLLCGQPIFVAVGSGSTGSLFPINSSTDAGRWIAVPG